MAVFGICLFYSPNLNYFLENEQSFHSGTLTVFFDDTVTPPYPGLKVSLSRPGKHVVFRLSLNDTDPTGQIITL